MWQVVCSDDFIELGDVDKLSNHCEWVMFECYLLGLVSRLLHWSYSNATDPLKHLKTSWQYNVCVACKGHSTCETHVHANYQDETHSKQGGQLTW